MSFLKLRYLFLCSVSLFAEDSEYIENTNMRPNVRPPPNASNAITSRAQLNVFKDPSPHPRQNDNEHADDPAQNPPPPEPETTDFPEENPYMNEGGPEQRNLRGPSGRY